MKKLAAVSIIAIALLAYSCDRQSSSQSPATPVEVRLGYFPNLTHGQAVLGVSSGDFATALAPAKLTPRQFNAGPDLINALLSGNIDIGYVGPGPAINGFVQSHGQGIVVISGAAANGVVIVARKDSGINSLADLAGKKIATPQHANTQDIAARHYLTAVLKQPNTDNVLAISNPDQAGAMARGNIDAAWAPEPWGSMLISTVGAKPIAEEKDLWPSGEFSLTVMVTTPDFLKAHADFLEKLLTAHRTWTSRLSTDPDKYAGQLNEALYGLTGKRLPDDVAISALHRVKFTDDPSPDTFTSDAQWAFDLGFTKEKANLDGLMDLTILRKLQGGK